MKVLLDTDFLINLFVPNEPNNGKAHAIMKDISECERFALNLVSYEIATVLSRKYAHSFALKILDDLKKTELHIMRFSEEDEKETWKQFFSYTKKNISFVDCANLVVAKKHNFKIASFDAFYPKERIVSTNSSV